MLRNLKSFNPSEIEEKVLALWKEKGIFDKTLIQKKEKKIFKFWEGPPTANGRPGIHHVLARSFKDVILRFKTMRGYVVPRKAGWDTHGLPVEIQVEKQLGLSSKKEIEKYGISEFNKKCKESVWIYKSEWEKLTERMGFWLDLNNPYITYENRYIETLWWIIKKIWDKDLMYQGHKIVPWCPRCGTTLSSHEVALGYKEVTENSVYIKFKLNKGQKIGDFTTDDNTHILSWTTTPWTLPGNLALAIGKNIQYKAARDLKTKEIFILAFGLIGEVLRSDNLENLADIKGKDLVGLSYEPLFEIKSLKSKTSYKIYPADFVTTTDGTGVVHTAPMYGEDDCKLGKKVGLIERHTVDENGNFTDEVKGFEGLFVKGKATEDKIFEYLKENGNLLSISPYTHEYPHCWRCDTPLLYYARTSWFIEMAKLKNKLLERNKKVNWIPAHIKEGRFGEWLKDVKDWNFSRERYWGTPIPIWRCDKCGKLDVIGSQKELKTRGKKGNNKYILLRHGESQNNVKNISNSDGKDRDKYPLTLKGKMQAQSVAKKIKKERVDMIFCSNFRRVRETMEIIAKEIEVKDIKFDKRLEEINTGIFHERPISEYHAHFTSYADKFTKRPPEGESLEDVSARVFDFFKELEKKYKNKTILIVSHEYPIWMMASVLNGWSQEESIAEKEKEKRGNDFVENAGFEKFEFQPSPRNENGICDFHKPYIDDYVFGCANKKCKGKMKRTKEVADCWFDSGAMPFAQEHFPFEARNKNGGPEIYPADYICEAVDQTRGWFYTLLSVAALLGYDTPYKNVISLGLIHDKFGQKMSKSKGNIVDPWAMINKYGVDSVRWYFYSINAPGESKNFDENDLLKTVRNLLMTLYNSFAFLQLYGKDKIDIEKITSKKLNEIDRWILCRLKQAADEVGAEMNKYDILKSTQILSAFVDDLSKWHIRRSRRRFQKPASVSDLSAASSVLAYVLLESSKIFAPFIPFFSDALYQSLKKMYKFKSLDSVHLESWPEISKAFSDENLVNAMNEIRNVASAVLAKRAELGIKVRQPLSELRIKKLELRSKKGLLEILADEINVKKIVFDDKITEEFVLDTDITPELKAEGSIREIARLVQGLRQEAGYVPKDNIEVSFLSSKEVEELVKNNENVLKKEIGAKRIFFREMKSFDVETAQKINGVQIKIMIKKV